MDRVVSAEVPDKDVDPDLYRVVQACMVHGPCGALNPTCPCMDDMGQCTKFYPKQHRQDTEMNVGGYPAYRRRELFPKRGADGGIVFAPRSVNHGKQDSTWIVPYNAYLLKRYNCHLNTEVCTTIKAVKYLYKYSFKGPDRACIEVGVNEVQDFLDARYVGAPEACWRLFEFPLHTKSHQVVRLAVHLPKEQHVIYKSGEEEQAVARARSRKTPLEAWFSLSSSLPSDHPTRKIRYCDMPSFFTWDSQLCRWMARRRGPKHGLALGRMFNVKPSAGELYYLRLLLLHVPGATSWDDFLCSAPFASGEAMPTSLREAARAHGLLHDDAETIATLRDALEYTQTGGSTSKIHEFFAVALIELDVADPVCLWQTYLGMLRQQKEDKRDASYAGITDEELACEAYAVVDDILQGISGSHQSLESPCRVQWPSTIGGRTASTRQSSAKVLASKRRKPFWMQCLS